MNILVPARLKKGDLIGIVSPASPVSDRSRIERGVRYLETLGYRVTVGRNVEKRLGYLAGTDRERADDLHAMFRARNVKALFCARGGYGTPRLLPLLDYRLIARNAKILLGYSDITALALALWHRCRMVTYHGPMSAVDLAGDVDAYAEESLWRTLTSPARRSTLAAAVDSPWRSPGSATGRLLGGNLSLLISLIGTPYQPDFRRAILFLEEIGEDPYRVDRMLTHIAASGVTRRCAAIALGQFTACTPRDPAAPTRTLDEVLVELAARTGKPLLGGFPIGHEARMATVPVGVRARLDGERRLLELLEAPVS